MRGLTATQAAVVQLSVPVLVASGGVARLGEALTPRLLACGAIILGGVALAVVGRAKDLRPYLQSPGCYAGCETRKKLFFPVRCPEMRIQPPWKDLLLQPLARDHVIQLYRDERFLVEAVALFTAIALGKGESVVLVVTPLHLRGIEQRLESNGYCVDDVRQWGQLTVRDASETLSGVMVQEMPDPLLFKTIIGSSIQKAAVCSRTGRVRVYGELVNLLWRQNLPAARRLEVLWNEVIQAHSISLFCACHVGGDEAESRRFPSDLRAAHSHLIPVEACA